jgi:hypothetical protein
VCADEEIRQYPGAATSSITVALKHLTGEKQRRPWYLDQLKSDLTESPVSFLDTRVTDRELGVHYGIDQHADVKQKVKILLGKLSLDESAIEAEAMRCAAHEIELLQRLVVSLEARWQRTLRALREHRAESVGRLRNSAAIIDGNATEIAPRRISLAR